MSAENLRQFKNFSQNLKRTAFGVKFGKKLFTNPGSLSPKDIIAAFKILGLDIPREVEITADLAQAIATSQAIYAGYEAGKSASELTTPTIAAVNLGVKLGTELGWISDEDDSTATTVQLTSSVAMLICSGGLSWSSWASLAMMSYSQKMKNEIGAKQLAIKNLSDFSKTYFAKEQIAWAKNIQELNSGKIGIMGWITKNAMTASSVFYQSVKGNDFLISKFPFLENIDALPIQEITFRSESSQSDTFLGGGEFNKATESASMSIRRIAEFKTEDEARAAIFKGLIEPQLMQYRYANQYFSSLGKMNIENLFVMFSLGAPLSMIFPGQDVSQYLMDLMLSPFELNETFIQEFLSVEDKSLDMFHGNLISGDFQVKAKEKPSFDKYREALKSCDRSGDVEKLFYFKEIKKVLSERMTYDMIPDKFKTALDRGGKSFQYKEKFQGWRKIQNFAVSMQYLDMIRKDPFFFKWENENLGQYEFIHDLDFVQGKISYLNKLSMIRRINRLAYGNVQFFVGNAKKKNRGEIGPAIFET